MQSPEEGGASRRKVAFHPTVTVDVENEGGEAAAAVAAKRLHIYLLHVGIERSIVVRCVFGRISTARVVHLPSAHSNSSTPSHPASWQHYPIWIPSLTGVPFCAAGQ